MKALKIKLNWTKDGIWMVCWVFFSSLLTLLLPYTTVLHSQCKNVKNPTNRNSTMKLSSNKRKEEETQESNVLFHAVAKGKFLLFVLISTTLIYSPGTEMNH